MAKHAAATRTRAAPPARRPDRRDIVFIQPPGRAVFGYWPAMSWDNSGTFVEVRFGPFCLHPIEGLTRGARELHVTPKSLSVLHFLASRPRKVVAKDELIRAVWRDVAVSDSALTSCIKELRRALKDDAKQPRFIETLNRRGFRFIAEILAPAASTPATCAPNSRATRRCSACCTATPIRCWPRRSRSPSAAAITCSKRGWHARC